MEVTAVFTTGAFVRDAEFWFKPLADALEPHGIAVRSVELASCGDRGPLGDLHDDAARIRAALDEIDGPVILGGHSYGGIVITEAAVGQRQKVKHLLYLSGIVTDKAIMRSDYIVPTQIPLIELPDANLLQRMMLRVGRTRLGKHLLRVPGAAAMVEALFREATVGEGPGVDAFKSNELRRLANQSIIDEGLRRVTRQGVVSFLQPPNGAAYEQIPSTYVFGLEDGEVPRRQLLLQASRCSDVISVPTNHFCHLDRPDLIAEIVVDIARGLGLDEPPAAKRTRAPGRLQAASA